MNDFLELTQGLVETHNFEESSNFEPMKLVLIEYK